MLKKILCLFACLIVFLNSFAFLAFAQDYEDGQYRYFNIEAQMCNSDGEDTYRMIVAEIYVPTGAHTTVYDDLLDSSGKIVYRNNIAFDNNQTLSAVYGYLIGLINSSTISQHAIINVEAEVNNLNYFIQQKWDDPNNNYEYRSYIAAAQTLGILCMYSYDTCGLKPIEDNARDPYNEIIFYDWFNKMNQKFLNDWFEYYNSKYEETNGMAFCTYTLQPDTPYNFSVGERKAKPFGTIDVLYTKAEYYAYNLHFDGAGSYVGVNDNFIDFVFNTLGAVRIDQWAAWMPGPLAGVIISFFTSIVGLLTVMMTIKLVRG